MRVGLGRGEERAANKTNPMQSRLGAEGEADEAVERLEEWVRAMPAPEAHVCLDPAPRPPELAERRILVSQF